MPGLPRHREEFRFVSSTSLKVPNDLWGDFALLHNCWMKLAAGGDLPARQSISLPDLPPALRGLTNLLGVEISETGGHAFRFRLFGSLQRMETLVPPTGRLIAEVIPDASYCAMMQQHYSEVVTARAPRFDRIFNSVGPKGHQAPYSYDRLILPLSFDGLTVTDLMTCSLKTPESSGG